MEIPNESASKKWENSSGIWLGEIIENVGPNTGRRQQLLCVLTLLADAPSPSAFGASVKYGANDILEEVISSGQNVNIWHGVWEHTSQRLKLTELSLQGYFPFQYNMCN